MFIANPEKSASSYFNAAVFLVLFSVVFACFSDLSKMENWRDKDFCVTCEEAEDNWLI